MGLAGVTLVAKLDTMSGNCAVDYHTILHSRPRWSREGPGGSRTRLLVVVRCPDYFFAGLLAWSCHSPYIPYDQSPWKIGHCGCRSKARYAVFGLTIISTDKIFVFLLLVLLQQASAYRIPWTMGLMQLEDRQGIITTVLYKSVPEDTPDLLIMSTQAVCPWRYQNGSSTPWL